MFAFLTGRSGFSVPNKYFTQRAPLRFYVNNRNNLGSNIGSGVFRSTMITSAKQDKFTLCKTVVSESFEYGIKATADSIRTGGASYIFSYCLCGPNLFIEDK